MFYTLLDDITILLNFLFEDISSTILCWFLPYINMNQPQVCIFPLPPEPPSHFPPCSTPLGCHKALGWASCVTQRFPLAIYFTYGNVCISMPLFQFVLPSPSKVSQKEKGKYCIITSVWNLERWYWWNYLQDSNGDTDRRASPRGMVWGWRWEGSSGLRTCVHPWWMHVDVWQNQYNIVKLKKKKRICLQCRRPGLGISPGGGHGNPRQYSCLENPMDRGAWCHRVGHNWVTKHSIVSNRVIHNFNSYTSFIVTIKYWLYYLCCAMYPCSLSILYIVVCTS